MTTMEIANDLAGLCRQGKNLDAIEKYYADGIVSVEPMSAPGMPSEMAGIAAIKGKNQWWLENHQVHKAEVKGPLVAGNYFAVEFNYDVTQKASGHRFQMTEIGLYTVADGKIVHEHFYYSIA